MSLDNPLTVECASASHSLLDRIKLCQSIMEGRKLQLLSIEILDFILRYEGTSQGVINLWLCGSTELSSKLANGGSTRLILTDRRIRSTSRWPLLLSQLSQLRHLSITHRNCLGSDEYLRRCFMALTNLESLELNSPSLGRALCTLPSKTEPSNFRGMTLDISPYFPHLRKLVLTGPGFEIDLHRLPEYLEWLELDDTGHFSEEDLRLVVKLLPRSLTCLKLRMSLDEEDFTSQLADLPPALTSLSVHPWRLHANSMPNPSQVMSVLPDTLTDMPARIQMDENWRFPASLTALSLDGFPSDPAVWNKVHLPLLKHLNVITTAKNLLKPLTQHDILWLPRSITHLQFRHIYGPRLDLSAISPSDFPPKLRLLHIHAVKFDLKDSHNLPSTLEDLFFAWFESNQSIEQLAIPPRLTVLNINWAATTPHFDTAERLSMLPATLTDLSKVDLGSYHLFGLLPRRLTRLGVNLFHYPFFDAASTSEDLVNELPHTLQELEITIRISEAAEVINQHELLLEIIKTLPAPLKSLRLASLSSEWALDSELARALPRAMTFLMSRLKVDALAELPPALTTLEGSNMAVDPADISKFPRTLRRLSFAKLTREASPEEFALLPPHLDRLHMSVSPTTKLTPQLLDVLPMGLVTMSGLSLP